MKENASITAKVEPTLLRLSVPLPSKLELTSSFLWSKFIIHNIFIIAKIPNTLANTRVADLRFNDTICLLVDVGVRVLLSIMDLFHTTAFLDQVGIIVLSGSRPLTIHFADFENILQRVQRYLNDFVVHTTQEIA